MKNAMRTGNLRGRVWPGLMALSVLIGCMGTETTNPKSGNGSETEPGISGTLVDGSGIPVGGATVKFFPDGEVEVDGEAGIAADSALTDERGRYSIGSLPVGDYNLIGEYGNRNLKVLIPRIPYNDPKFHLDIGVDTLRAPGQIQGSVTLGGRPREGVFCYLPGTSFLSISDGNGGCWIADVPAGRYSVRYAGTGLATVADTGVVVKAGAITTLAPKEMSPDTAVQTQNPLSGQRVRSALPERITVMQGPGFSG